ncbi:golgin subfamily A member 6-like protein 1 isoform X2 [Brienomyrus brachyistius]|uniref:golgin subfamily A member 6-like protein 1 isoform X2 n=1 Tax=Brienomyrus brachyistius TaxID=42636 RepID=UPI0020B38C9C|nr:golgin subfamily A member 6-like protein 1 isoform X2 [Brienomyrus brachyistius]
MASRLVSGRPAVLVVVEHLYKKLKSERVLIGEEVSRHLKKISATLIELEASRRAAHERLEVESIQTSKMRLHVAQLEERIAQEIAARNSNVDLIDALQAEIKDTSQNVEYMEKRSEREFMKPSHEHAIKQPHCRRSRKASKQIFINDTNKKIQSLRKQIGQAKKAQEDLKDCMVQIRCKFTERKQTLTNGITHMKQCISSLDTKIQLLHRQLGESQTEVQQPGSVKDFHNMELAELWGTFEESRVLQEQLKVKREMVDSNQAHQQALINPMELLNTQTKAENERWKSHLSMSRQEAVRSQADVIWRSSEDLHKADEEHEREITETIKYNRKKQADLQEEHQLMDPSDEDLSKTLEITEEQYQRMQASGTAAIEELMREAESVEEKLLKKEEELRVQESVLKEVEARHDMEQASWKTGRSHLEELNCKRSQLEKSIQQLREETEALLHPKEALKQKIKRLNAQHVQLLRAQALEISTMEKRSYEDIVTLERFSLENSRLRTNIKQMKADIRNTNREKEKRNREAAHLRHELQSLHEHVLDAWKTDLFISEEHAKTNQTVLQAINQVGLEVQERKNKVEELGEKLRIQVEGAAPLLRRTAGKSHLNALSYDHEA